MAVSATRVKVVAIERFAHQRRSTLTRSATTAGWRLRERGGAWLRSEPFRASPEKLILSAWRPMPATPPERWRLGVSRLVKVCGGPRTARPSAGGPLRRSVDGSGVAAGQCARRTPPCGPFPDDLATGSNFGAEIDPSSKIIPTRARICPLCPGMRTGGWPPFPGRLSSGGRKGGPGWPGKSFISSELVLFRGVIDILRA